MTINKNFVVKNGLEVNTDLILADTTKSSVGIATSVPNYTLHVNGGIGATDLNVTGIATALQVDATTLNVDTGNIITGVVTTISGTTLNYTNISGSTFDGSLLNVNDLYAVSGLVTHITGTASTFTSSDVVVLDAETANIVSGFATNLTVSGVSTFTGNINISGIVTAISGAAVTYYGDGQYLTGIQPGVGLRTESEIVGYGATLLDFRGEGVIVTPPVSGISTITVDGGSGSISISTTAPLQPDPGDLWYSPDRARTFIYYDENEVGYGTGAQWIDASPFNVGVLTQTSLIVPEINVTGNTVMSGILTVTGGIFGDLTGNVTGNVTGDLTGTATTATNATSLETARNINGTAFDGTADITVEPYVEDDESSTTSKYLTFVDSSTAAFQRLNEDSGLSYIPSLGALTVDSVRSYQSLVGTASSTRIDYTVTVSSKTSNHRYSGQGSSNGFYIDGIESPFITLLPGKTYRFDQSDSSNGGHPLAFYLEADKTTSYTTNVTTDGGPAGSAGSYVEILITDSTPQVLHYQCSSHAYMGNALSANSNIAGGFSVADESSDTSCNVLFTTDATGPALSAKSGTNLTFNSSSGALTATSFVKSGGTSSQFLKADGSVDSSTYITSADGGDAATLDSLDSTQFLRSDDFDVKTSGNLRFNDNVQLTLGTSNALQITHDGSNSYIDNVTGSLYLRNSANDLDIVLQTDNGSGGLANYVFCDGGSGIVYLYYYGSQKLNTKSDGVDITGEMQCDSLDVDGNGDISGTLTVGAISGNVFSTVTATASNKTVINREYCAVTASGRTITLPASPSAGDQVIISVGNFTDTVIARNGSNIMGLAENITVDVAYAAMDLVYIDATRGWRIS